MANRPTTSAKKSPRPAARAPAGRAPAARPAATVVDDDVIPVEYTQSFLARHPALTDAQLAAYGAQCADAEADKLGAQTVSDVVAADGRRALKRGERMLTAHGRDIRYPMRRLVFLAHCLRALERDIARQKGQRATTAPSPAEAEAALRTARTTLVTALDEVLEGNAHFAAAQAALRGDVHEPTALLDATGRAVALGREVLASHDAALALLAEDHGLDRATLDAAARAGRALQAALDGRSDERTHGDTPEVNRAEGRVLFELRKLHRVLDAAHRQNNLVERYVPTPVLQRLLGGGHHTAEPKAPGPTAGAPGTAAVATT